MAIFNSMTNAVESPPVPLRGAQLWPLSVAGYRAFTSHDYDRSKLRAYASAGVIECWLILGLEQKIEVYRQLADGRYTERSLHGPGGSLASVAVPEFTLALHDLFA